ncbi:MAG: hypothetical protein L7V87_06335 [Verrucomicrobiales bacterium]|nr:hypothetical protein [Verrucomicrobiales bacterium]
MRLLGILNGTLPSRFPKHSTYRALGKGSVLAANLPSGHGCFERAHLLPLVAFVIRKRYPERNRLGFIHASRNDRHDIAVILLAGLWITVGAD